jgi:tetratricopeptide (TPR) repeat protein
MNTKITTYILFFLMLTIGSQSVSAQRDVRTNIRQGNRAYNQQRFSEASTLYEDALNENATSREAIFNLGNALYRQGEWERATEQFRNFLSLERENPMLLSAAFRNLGNAFLRQDDLQNSLEAYKASLRLNPMDDEARYNLAVVQRLIQEEEDECGGGQDDQEQEQQEQESQQNQQQEQRVEETDGPEQMSRENARQILQAIEQNEQETLDRVQRMRATEREQQMEENRRLGRNW